MFKKDKFEEALRLSNVTKRELAQALGINESTLYRKIQNNGSFDRYEIDRMVEYLKIDNPTEIFFAA